MHKLRNTKHIEILNSMLTYIPLGTTNPISKRKMRQFLSINEWDQDVVFKKFKSGDWIYCWPFYRGD